MAARQRPARELHAAGLKARQARVPLIEALLKQKKANETHLDDANFQIADSFELLAISELQLGDPASALEHFVASEKGFAALKANDLEVRRRRAEAQLRLGDVRFALRQFDDAEKSYHAALPRARRS